MDREADMTPLDGRRLKAGEEYLESLEKLGMYPDVLAWAYDKDGSFMLVLVTSLFDTAGPLRLSEQLFKAYNLSATPKEIDPFVVEIHSPAQVFSKTLIEALRSSFHTEIREDDGPWRPLKDKEHAKVTVTSTDPDYEQRWFPLNGVYAWLPPHEKSHEASRMWSRFIRNIEKLAA